MSNVVVCAAIADRSTKLLWRSKVISAPLETWSGAEDYVKIARRSGMLAWIARAGDYLHVEITHMGEQQMEKRIYVVKVVADQGLSTETELGERLIKAANPAQAIRHVVKNMVTAKVATQDDLVRLAPIKQVEEAGDAG